MQPNKLFRHLLLFLVFFLAISTVNAIDFNVTALNLKTSYIRATSIDLNGYTVAQPQAGGTPITFADINAYLYDENNVLVDSNTQGLSSDGNGYYQVSFTAPNITIDTNYYFNIHATKSTDLADLNTVEFKVIPFDANLILDDLNSEADANSTVFAKYLDENLASITGATVTLTVDGNITAMTYDSVNSRYYAYPQLGWVGVHTYSVTAVKSNYATKTDTNSITIVQHPVQIAWSSTNFTDANSIGPVTVSFDCNSSIFCDSNAISGGDVNFVIRDDQNTVLKSGLADYNTANGTYDFNDYNFQIVQRYNILVKADKNEYNAINLSKIITNERIDVNHELATVHISPNVVLANTDFNVNGTLTFQSTTDPVSGATVFVNINNARYQTTSSANGSYFLTVTSPSTSGIKHLEVKAKTSNGVTGKDKFDLNVLDSNASVTITADIYQGTDTTDKTAEPGDLITVSYTITPDGDVNDANIQLLFPEWEVTPSTSITVDDANSISKDTNYISSQTFSVPPAETSGTKIITIRASWKNRDNTYATQDYNLYQTGDRNYLTISSKRGVRIDIVTDKNIYDFYETADVNFTIAKGFDKATQVFAYDLKLRDLNGDELLTIYSSTTKSVVNSAQTISVDSDFNTGLREAKNYLLRVHARYADIEGIIRTAIRNHIITIGSTNISVSTDKNTYTASEDVNVFGAITTDINNVTLNGSLEIKIYDENNALVDSTTISNISITNTSPYNYDNLFERTGSTGNFTVNVTFKDGQGNKQTDANQTYNQGTVNLTISSSPSTSGLQDKLSIAVNVVGINGPNDNLGLSAFTITDQDLTSYSLESFSNVSGGDYSFKITAPNITGNYTFTVQVTETINGVDSSDSENFDVNVSRHTLSVVLHYDGNYTTYTMEIPGYVTNTTITDASTSSSTSVTEIDYALTFNDENMTALVSTGQSYSYSVTKGGNQADIMLKQNIRNDLNNSIYIVFTNVTKSIMEDRIIRVKNGTFRNLFKPAFGFGNENSTKISTGLSYSTSDVGIDSELNLPIGSYGILFTNAGKRDGKTQVTVEIVPEEIQRT